MGQVSLRKEMLVGLLSAAIIVLGLPSLVQAATFVVSNTNDAGPGSLRGAISRANNNSGKDTITFASGVSGRIVLTSGQLLITDDVAINGPGTRVLAVSGNHASRVFEINSSSAVTLTRLTVTEGFPPPLQGGGGIRNFGTLTLTDMLVTENDSGTGSADDANGGGIENLGSLTIVNSVISKNSAPRFGGGIASGFSFPNTSSLTLRNSKVIDNVAGESGGGIIGGPLVIENSIISRNVAGEDTGGISTSGPLTIKGSVISDNRGQFHAGGIQIFGGGATVITSSRVTGNIGDDGGISYIDDRPGSLTVANSLISGNTVGLINDTGTVLLRNSTRVLNNPGGGIRNVFSGGTESATLTVRSSTISGNGSTDRGGGIYNGAAGFGQVARNVTVNLISSTVTNNTAVTGGGVYNQGTLSLQSSAIRMNTATGGPGSGGGVFNEGGTVSIDANSTVSDNVPDDCVGC
jgi:hypothetical protein